MDLSNARITWEARDQEPGLDPELSFVPEKQRHPMGPGRGAFARRPPGLCEGCRSMPMPRDIVWIDDALPAGAVVPWMAATPGIGRQQSAPRRRLRPLVGCRSRAHQHYFSNATAPLSIGTGDVLYALDSGPRNPPSEMMLQWNDGSWDHRAYWAQHARLRYRWNRRPALHGPAACRGTVGAAESACQPGQPGRKQLHRNGLRPVRRACHVGRGGPALHRQLASPPGSPGAPLWALVGPFRPVPRAIKLALALIRFQK